MSNERRPTSGRPFFNLLKQRNYIIHMCTSTHMSIRIYVYTIQHIFFFFILILIPSIKNQQPNISLGSLTIYQKRSAPKDIIEEKAYAASHFEYILNY